MAQIKFDQVGLESPGEWDKTRTDGLSNGAEVTVTTSSPGLVELLWAPIDDNGVAEASLHQTSPTVWKFTPNDDIYGTYRVRFTPTANPLISTIRLFSILTPTGLRIPALNERSDPNASLIHDGPTMVAASEFNVDGEGAFGAGDYGGSYSAFEKLFLTVDTLALNARRSPADSSVYPIQSFTPGGESLGELPLTNANIAQSIRNAISQAQADGGGVVLIPRGQWTMGNQEIELTAVSRSNWITIRGAGMDRTSLIYPDAYTGTAFKFSGVNEPNFMFNGGMEDLTITCLTDNVENTGTGLHLEACINTQLRNITIRNFKGGTGLKTRRVGEGGTNQYVQLYNFTVAGCDINYDLEFFVNCQGYGVYSTAGQTHDYLLNNVNATFYGGNTQTSCDIAVLLSGSGGSRMTFDSFYWEGVNALMTLFKCETPSVTYNTLCVKNMHVGGEPAIFLDTDAFNNCSLIDIYNSGLADTIVKARNGAPVMMSGSGNPATSPGKFDLDDASLAVFTAFDAGCVFTGGKAHAVKGHALQPIAEGSEPSSPSAGDLIYNSTSGRPRVRVASSWRDSAYADDPADLTSILAPYAVAIFDPALIRCRTLAAGNTELASLIDLLNGSTMAAPSSGQRPVWNAADEFFGGKPSFTCALSGDHYLEGTLSPAVPISSHAGVFAVFRIPGNDPSNRRLVIAAEHAGDRASALAIGQSDLNKPNQAYGYVTGSNAFTFAEGSLGSDTWGHVSYVYSDAFGRFARDLETLGLGLTPGPTATVIDFCRLGGAYNGLDIDGCDVTIAYAAVLSSSLSAGDRAKAIAAAMAKYSIR